MMRKPHNKHSREMMSMSRLANRRDTLVQELFGDDVPLKQMNADQKGQYQRAYLRRRRASQFPTDPQRPEWYLKGWASPSHPFNEEVE